MWCCPAGVTVPACTGSSSNSGIASRVLGVQEGLRLCGSLPGGTVSSPILCALRRRVTSQCFYGLNGPIASQGLNGENVLVATARSISGVSRAAEGVSRGPTSPYRHRYLYTVSAAHSCPGYLQRMVWVEGRRCGRKGRGQAATDEKLPATEFSTFFGDSRHRQQRVLRFGGPQDWG